MWLFVPSATSPTSPCAPGGADSKSEPSWQFQALAQSALWRSKLSRPKSWRARWMRAAWLKHLCGRMLEPSTAARGAAEFVASLPVIRASPSASPASEMGLKTRGTSGRRSPESSERLSPISSSWRTSPGICTSDCVKSLESFSAWTTGLQSASSERRKWALLTAENDSSSWPTPRASVNENRTTHHPPSVEDGRGHGRTLSGEANSWPTSDASVSTGYNQSESPGSAKRPALAGLASVWPTPTAGDSKASGSAAYPTTETHQQGTTLTDAAVRQSQWATPGASDGEKGGPHSRDSSGSLHLASQALRRPAPSESAWPTPTVQDAENNGATSQQKRNTPPLNALASQWPTPNTPNGGRSMAPKEVANKGATERGKRQVGIESVARIWPTPTSQESTGYMSGTNRDTWRPGLAAAAKGMKPSPTRPAPTTQTDGESTSPSGLEPSPPSPSPISRRAGRVLNPRFVEALMGWPQNWTRVCACTTASTVSESSATG